LIAQGGREIDLDVRLSDALELIANTEIPILVEDSLLIPV
jgi:bifunctional DNase/RNase